MSGNSIPVSQIVQVTPGVLSAGGSGVNLTGMCLSNSNRVPIGQFLSFPSSLSVAAFFGGSSVEASLAATYFLGFDNSNIKPGAMLFAQYNTAAVPAYLRGGSVAALTLAQLQALSGALTISVNGTPITSSNINLLSATSFSNAASIIQGAFTTPGFTVSYDSVSGAFVFTNNTSGASSAITVASGTLAASLNLTTATGAVTSQGAIAAVPSTFMNALINLTQNWVSFFTAFDPDNGSGNANKLLFAQWTNAQNNRFLYIPWDTDITPTQSTNASSCLAQKIKAGGYSGSAVISTSVLQATVAAFLSGTIASTDTTEKQGRVNPTFKGQSGITPDVFNPTVAQNLLQNGYNFYGDYSDANEQFLFFNNGNVSGQYNWIDSYINQIWMTTSFQSALIHLLTSVKSLPYNNAGYALMRAALQDPIDAALNFGAIQPGVPLSNQQASQVNNAAGIVIDTILDNRGWYLQILPASAVSRANRTSPPCTFWYTDGGSVQQINLASITIQ